MNELGKPRVKNQLPNIFSKKPAVGTILATMTADELTAHQRVWEESQACDVADDISYNQAIEVVERKNRFWEGICRKY
ncbi:hypothetical protein, partial [Klebsiella pneumoniae]|uniref:hypothetical protein n=1 Tax=Klebsiella pneumoniae TaxID=573 RepID=UPI003B97FDBB